VPVNELRLAFRAPLDWQALLGFLAPRAIPGVELVAGLAYCRVAEGGVQIEVTRSAAKAELRLVVHGEPPARLIDFAARARRLLICPPTPPAWMQICAPMRCCAAWLPAAPACESPARGILSRPRCA